MERLGYQRFGDFLRDYEDNRELAYALAYLHQDDEIQLNRLIYAIVKAFGRGNEQQQQESVIDTTKPEFAQTFQGFTNTPLQG